MRAEQAIRICEACDRFEWNWLKGDPLPIERFLDEARPEDRCFLFEDLLRIELEWRRDAGEEPEEREYVGASPIGPSGFGTSFAKPRHRVTRRPSRPSDDTRCSRNLGGGDRASCTGPAKRASSRSRWPSSCSGPGLSAHRPTRLRFCEEIQTLARVNHPHVVPFLGSGDDRGQLFYAMRA